jgi:hypothetical protein
MPGLGEICPEGEGMMLVGAHPLETFREIIEEELQASRDRRAPEKVR